MEIDDIKKLINDLMEMMADSKLAELEVEIRGTRVCLRRESSEPRTSVVTVPAPTLAGQPAALQGGPAPTGAPATAEATRYKQIRSPMVGTFYQAPSPETDPYTEAGQLVEEDTVVCIVEAMKVMNEIKAEMKGKIVEVLVNNGEAVEFGQPLFLVDPEG